MASRRLRDSYGGYRSRLVEELRSQGIDDIAVLHAFGETPRHRFVPEAVRRRAYENTALPIGHGQTISQPYVQALYLQALELDGHEKALEVGTGSGYQTALLAQLVDQVVSIERVSGLADEARAILDELGYSGVLVTVGDGTLGWRPLAPYDAILVAAAGPEVPKALLEQLAPGGRLVMPIDERGRQRLIKMQRTEDGFEESFLCDVRFVPLIGRQGFGGSDEDGDEVGRV